MSQRFDFAQAAIKASFEITFFGLYMPSLASAFFILLPVN